MLNFMNVKVGQRLQLRDGRLAEVTENIGDGIWLEVRFASADGSFDEGADTELLHCEEVSGVAEPG